MKHAKVADKPIKEMLDNVASGLVSTFLEKYYDGDQSKVPTVDYIGAPPASEPVGIVGKFGIRIEETETDAKLTLGQSLPPVSAWMELLAGPKVSWLRAALTSINVVQGGSYVDNPLKRIFAPRRGQVVSIQLKNGQPSHITITGAA